MRKEIEERQREEFVALGIDSDHELDSSDEESTCYSESEAPASPSDLNYSLDQMFDIIKRRDFNQWSSDTIRHRFKKLSTNPSTFRSQLTR